MALTQVRGKGLGTLGDGTANDTAIVFDGNAQDFHIGLDDSTDSLTIGLGSTLGTTSHMVFDANGHITKPLQPAFLVSSATENNFARNTNHTMNINSEVFDNNNDVSTTNNNFTAPVTGKYQFNIIMYFQNIVIDSNYLEIYLVTSNRQISSFIIDPSSFDEAITYHSINGSIITDMDAGDTASIQYRQSGGTDTTTDFAGSASYFSGFLVC